MAASEYAGIIEPPFGQGANFMPGTAQVLYICPVGDIATFGTAPATPANKKYTITTPHVCKTGKKFTKMYVAIEKGQLQFEALGSREGSGFKVSGTGYIPGDSDDLTYFANEAQADRFIIIMKLANGTLSQVGTEDYPATIRMAHDSETVTGDSSGYAVRIEAYMPYKLLYSASVPLTPAV
ncbi:hypothetical protein ACWKW6_12795 [Dyadobacter jiangsuensis]